MSDKARKIALIAAILAIMGFLYATSISGGGGISVNKTVFEFHQCCTQTFHAINISNLSIVRDKIYTINIIGNGTGNTNIGIYINNDLNPANYSRQYIYASGGTNVAGFDHTSDFTAWSPGHSAQTKMVIQKGQNGQIRFIVEGNFDGGYINPGLLNFFNMQMSYNNKVDDITNISIITSGSLANGIDFYLFKG